MRLMSWIGKIFGSRVETPEEAIRRGQLAQGRPVSPPRIPKPSAPRARSDFRASSASPTAPPPLPEAAGIDESDHSPRSISSTFSPTAFNEWIDAIDIALTKGFSELQRQTLATKVGRLRVGDSVAMHYQLFHDGSPCGLKLVIQRTQPELLSIRADGSGASMDVLLDECTGRAGMFGELDESEDSSPRDARFRRDPDGNFWRAKLPMQAGLIFDYPLEVVVEQGRPGMIGGGEIWETPLLRTLLPNLPAICAETERQVLSSSADSPFDRDTLLPPTLILSCQVTDDSEWFIRIFQREGTSSNWRIDFHKTDCTGIRREA